MTASLQKALGTWPQRVNFQHERRFLVAPFTEKTTNAIFESVRQKWYHTSNHHFALLKSATVSQVGSIKRWIIPSLTIFTRRRHYVRKSREICIPRIHYLLRIFTFSLRLRAFPTHTSNAVIRFQRWCNFTPKRLLVLLFALASGVGKNFNFLLANLSRIFRSIEYTPWILSGIVDYIKPFEQMTR